MGVLKALSFGHFKLPFWVLRSLYKSLIRSLMEYTSFIVDTISNKNMRKLQIIQNKCLRIICKCDKSVSTDDLRKQADMCLVQERLTKMNRRFISTNILSKNPMVNSMIKDYVEFMGKCANKSTEPGPSVLQKCADLFTNDNKWLIQDS